jgi:hypothetical protein
LEELEANKEKQKLKMKLQKIRITGRANNSDSDEEIVEENTIMEGDSSSANDSPG